MGSPLFMSPEQAAGRTDELDERSDVYSLGALFYRFLTLDDYIDAKRPISEILKAVQHEKPAMADAKHHRHQVRTPRELSFILTRALAKNPSDRYQSVSEMNDALNLYLDGRAMYACPVVASKLVTHTASRFIDRNGLLGVVVFLGLFLLAMYGGLALVADVVGLLGR